MNGKPERLKTTLQMIKERGKLIAGVAIQEPPLRFVVTNERPFVKNSFWTRVI